MYFFIFSLNSMPSSFEVFAVLCSAILFCSVLCCAMWYCAVLCYGVSCCVVLCVTVLYCVTGSLAVLILSNCDIDIFAFWHHCHIMSLKFPKFKRVQNSAVNFLIAQKQKREIVEWIKMRWNYCSLLPNIMKFHQNLLTWVRFHRRLSNFCLIL